MSDEFTDELVERCAFAAVRAVDVNPDLKDADLIVASTIAVLRASKHAELVAAVEEALEFIDREAGDDRLGNRIRAALKAAGEIHNESR